MQDLQRQERYLSLRQVREMIGVSSTTLWRWQRQGQFPPRRILGQGRVGWLESEIIEWMKTRPAIGR
jgi:prophage regulatory protein